MAWYGMVLASRASGCLFGHQNPSGHPNYFHLHVMPMTFYKDIMPYFDIIYTFMVVI